MNDYVALSMGVICAGIGGEIFVRGAVGLAHWARISPGIIGATVAAFATSSPELSVSVNAALAGKPQIALGDALGARRLHVLHIEHIQQVCAHDTAQAGGAAKSDHHHRDPQVSQQVADLCQRPRGVLVLV